MAIFQAVLIGLVALILAPGASFYFDVTPKIVVLLAGGAVLCLMRPRVADRRFTICLAATAASAALSTFLSDRPWISLFGSTWRRYGLIEEIAVLIVAWFVAQLPHRRPVARGIAVASSVAALYGVSQYLGWDPILPASAYHIGEGMWTIVRPPGTLGYVSYFATWLLVAGFIGASLRTRAGYASAALCWSAMLLTGTRATLLGLAAGLLLWALRRGCRASRQVVVALACTTAGLAVFLLSPAGWNLRSRARWFAEDPWGGARPLLWRDSVGMASHRPAAGYGGETFTAEFPKHESAELARRYPDFAHESPHNILLDALVSQGLIGLLCLAAVCSIGLRATDPWLVAAMAAAVVAQQFTAFTAPTALLFYTTAALSLPPTSGRTAAPRFLLAPLAAVFLMAAVRLGTADYSLAKAQRAVTSGDLRKADEQFREYRRRKLPGASADVWYSKSLFAIAQHAPAAVVRLQALQMSAVAGEEATRTSEEPFNAWYHLATVRAAQGDAAATEAGLRQAIASHPNWFKPHWTLARLLQLEGRTTESLAEARRAADLNGGRDAEVAATRAEFERTGR